MTEAETARMLGVSIGTIKSQTSKRSPICASTRTRRRRDEHSEGQQ
jgi:DNA-directed RNA polymerase specialized sigma24 family protein